MPTQKSTPSLSTYLPIDRRHALATGHTLTDHVEGTALLADIAGFTPLADTLAASLGPQRGAEELTRLLNAVYDALIAQVHQYGGSVVSFAGDGLACWFDGDTGLRAVACGMEMQQAMAPFATTSPPAGAPVSLSVKCGVAAGSARRFLVGQPHIDLLAGAALDRVAQAEQVARQGEIVVAPEIVQALGDRLNLGDERDGFATVAGLTDEITPTPWSDLDPSALTTEQVRPYLLPPVYERLAAGQGEFLAELRPAAALFLRFEGLDYERDDAGSQLDAFVCRVQEILARYEGHLLQLTAGDKGSFLYAAFGALTAHEDDAARAVSAAMALRQIPAELDFITGVQIGLSQGRVRAGAYGSRTRRTYGAIGPEAIVACRLMEVAPPGQVWCSPAIHEAAGGQWEFEPLEPVALKGKTEPLPVYRPVRQTSGRAARAAGTLVGRQTELEALTRLLADVRSGQRRVLLLEGEAGIGKSRLLVELKRLAQQHGVARLEGAGQSIEQGTPYRAWRDVLATYFDLDQHADQAEQRQRVQERVTGVNPALTERVPLLNDVLRLDLPETNLTQSLDPKLRHESLTALIVDLLRARAAEGPLTLILEDAHWMDPLSWELALSVARALPSPPRWGEIEGGGLLVLALRPLDEPAPAEYTALIGMEDAEMLHLDALSLEETAALAASQMGVEPEALPLEVAALIQDRAGGNPFFAEELAHVLRDSGAVHIQDGVCSLTGDLGALRQRVPDTVEGVVLARIDRLPPEQQLTLKVAAVIGRGFLYRTLHDVHPRQVVTDLLQAQLDDLEQRELTLVEALEPELSYLFRHVITQQVAYDTLLFSRRRELHRAVAGWYERVYSENPSPYYSLLVHHWNRAEDATQERHYAHLAGEQAAAQYANAEAVRYLGCTLELTPEDDLEGRYALLLAREKVYDLQGNRERQVQDLEALEELASALADAERRGEVALQRAAYAEKTGEYAAAITAAQEAVELARAAQDASSEAAGYYQWGRALFQQGSFRMARAQLGNALALARVASSPKMEADSLRMSGNIAFRQADYDAAQDYYDRSLRVCCETDDRRGQADSLHNMSHLSDRQLDHEESKLHLSQALCLYREIGDRMGEGRSLVQMGNTHLRQHDYAQSQSCLEQALHITRVVGSRVDEGVALSKLGKLCGKQGDYAGARTYYEQALRIDQEIGALPGAAYNLNYFGILLLNQGSYNEAKTCFEQGLEISCEMEMRQLEAVFLACLGALFRSLGNYARAKGYYEQTLDIYQKIKGPRNECLTLGNLALLLHNLGDDKAARQYSRQALRIAQGIGEREGEGFALLNLGHALASLGHSAEAAEAYRRSVALHRELDQPVVAIESLAGLARVLLAQGDLSQALAQAAEILSVLLAHPYLEGTEEPFRVYLTCYQVLRAGGDPRAREILHTAYDLLQKRAAKIHDQDLRRSFLENVAAHREIIQAWERVG